MEGSVTGREFASGFGADVPALGRAGARFVEVLGRRVSVVGYGGGAENRRSPAGGGGADEDAREPPAAPEVDRLAPGVVVVEDDVERGVAKELSRAC